MITSRLYWKWLSEDGLLKDPIIGYGYNQQELNPWNGYVDEDEAIKDLEEQLKHIKYDKPHNLVLVKVFNEE